MAIPTVLSILFFVSLVEVIYPFRPFRKRRYALLVAIASLFGVGLTAPQNDLGTDSASNNIQAISEQQVAAEQREKTGMSDDTRQQLWILKTQDGVKQHLKDPSSAEFRNSRFVDFEGVPIVCGEVNAKNSFGGYGGFQHFIASGTKLAFLEQDMEPSEFRTAWNKMCAGL